MDAKNSDFLVVGSLRRIAHGNRGLFCGCKHDGSNDGKIVFQKRTFSVARSCKFDDCK